MKVTKMSMYEFTPAEIIDILSKHVENTQHVKAETVTLKIKGTHKTFDINVTTAPAPRKPEHLFLTSIVVATKEE